MSLKGSNNAEKIWNYLKNKGLNDFGISGVIGNLYAESGLQSNNLQNTGNTKLGMSDDEYVSAVDAGTYTKEQFIYDGFGFSIAQWTYWSRKKAFYEYAKSKNKSIGDLETALDFLWKELSESYKSVLSTLEAATSVLEASNAVLLKYERPADQSETVQKRRASYGQSYYDKYANKTTTSTSTELKYKENDIVDFTGTVHYANANATSGSACKAGVARVSNTAKGSHPYHLIKVSGGGSTVYGWVDETDISGLHEDKTTEESDKQTGGTTMGYTNSSLVTYTNLTKNKTTNRTHAIDCVTIHCIVGQWTAKQGCDYFANTDRQCSANYVVGKDGSIGLSVEEKDRSWCSSNAANDHRAITIEVASDTTEPYAVTDKAYSALLNLVTDICKRNGIKKLVWSTNKNDRVNHLNGCNMTVHRDYANKSCPGTYLYNKHGEIAEEVNKRLGAATETTTPTTPTAPTTNTSKLEFDVGDIVNFAGGKHYDSASATNGSSVKASKAKVTNTYEKGKHPYHLRAVNDNGAFISGVYGWVDASTVSAIKSEANTTFTPYRIKVTADVLNIRKGAGTNYPTNGAIRDKGVYTIVGESTGKGATKWLKLKSGAGYIASDYTKKI